MDDQTTTVPQSNAGIYRVDGWQNVFTGAGTGRDATTYTTAVREARLSEVEAENIYRAGGVGRNIVDLPANEMTRKWVTCKGEYAERLADEHKRLDAKKAFKKALTLAGLHGGAVIVMATDDSADLTAPLNLDGVSRLTQLHVFDRWRVTWDYTTLIADLNSLNFNEPAILRIQPITGANMLRVHRSRCLIFDGEPLPDRLRIENDYWGDSRLKAVKKAIQRWVGGLDGVGQIMQDFVQGVLSINNLGDLIGSGNAEQVINRLVIMGQSKSMINVMLLDAENEQYEKKISSVGGVKDLLDELKMNISASCGIPMTKLFGMSPGGLNATGESDIRNWYDDVSSDQQDRVEPQLNQLNAVIAATWGVDPSELWFEFQPLWESTEKEKAEVMQIKTNYVTQQLMSGLIDEDKAREELYGEEEEGIDDLV